VFLAIAVMAFGFILEKFDLSLEAAAPSWSAAYCRCRGRDSAT